MDSLKTKFQQIYSNLPLSQRQGVIVVIDNEPLSWNAANLEIDQDSDKGKQILETLVKLGIIR